MYAGEIMKLSRKELRQIIAETVGGTIEKAYHVYISPLGAGFEGGDARHLQIEFVPKMGSDVRIYKTKGSYSTSMLNNPNFDLVSFAALVFDHEGYPDVAAQVKSMNGHIEVERSKEIADSADHYLETAPKMSGRFEADYT